MSRLTVPALMVIAAVVGLHAPQAPAAVLTYVTTLSGPAESPPNNSPGTGSSTVTIDTDLSTMRIVAEFSGLVAPTTVSHIHCCTVDPFESTAGVATPVPSFPDFPTGVTSGTYDRTFDLSDESSWNPQFIAGNGGTVQGAIDAFLAGMNSGRAYLNVHSSEFMAGEIRGFYVPAPAGVWLLGTGLTALLAWRARAKAGS